MFLNKSARSVTLLGGAAEWKQGFSSQGSSCAPVLLSSVRVAALGPFQVAWGVLSEGFWLRSWVCPHWHLQSLLLPSSMSEAVGVSATYQKDKQFQPFKTPWWKRQSRNNYIPYLLLKVFLKVLHDFQQITKEYMTDRCSEMAELRQVCKISNKSEMKRKC